MKALLCNGTLHLSTGYPKPEPQEGEALIKVLLAGICNTDLEISQGYKGFAGVLGHEFVGVVKAVHGPRQELVGRRVVAAINLGCGACDACRRGLASHCRRRRVLGMLDKDGAMAEYVTLPVENLFPVPETVADEEAVFAEPLAAAFEILEQVHLKPSQSVLVMGDGKLGLLIAQVLRRSPAALTLLGRHPAKLTLAAGLGVHTITEADLPTDAGFDLVVEATGAAGFGQALRLVQPRGTLVLKSTLARPQEIDLAPLVVKEVTVVGSRCGPFPPALRALAAQTVAVRPLITRIYPFSQAEAAFAHARRKGTLKILLDLRSG